MLYNALAPIKVCTLHPPVEARLAYYGVRGVNKNVAEHSPVGSQAIVYHGPDECKSGIISIWWPLRLSVAEATLAPAVAITVR